MERNFAAFISYRHKPLDMACARLLHRQIEQYRIPRALRRDGRARLGLVFRDQEELPATSDLSGDICAALDRSEFLIVICTPDTPQSPWVSREITHFLTKHDRSHILAVLAAGTPDTSFPKELTDGGRFEPLAADLCGKNDAERRRKTKTELKRLYAVMINCPYDALIRREQKRKYRRAALAGGIALAVMLCFSAVLLRSNLEISRRNEELKVQNNEILTRESKMLAADSADALASGDTLSAVNIALSALPQDTENDRPYVGEAERALFSALDPLNPSDVIGRSLILEQETDVKDFCFSEDGTKVISLDGGGRLTCFDIDSGETLWVTEVGISYASRAILLTAGDTVIVSDTDAVYAADCLDGCVLWSLSCYSDSPSVDTTVNYCPLMMDNGRLLCLAETIDTRLMYSLQLLSVDVANGETKQSWTLDSTPYLSLFSTDDYAIARTAEGLCVAYSPNGKTLSSSKDLCCVLCRDDGSVISNTFDARLTNYPAIGITAMEDGTVVMAGQIGDKTAPFNVLRIDPVSGELIWEAKAETGEALSGVSAEQFGLLNDGNDIILYTDRYIFYFDPESGDIRAMKTLDEALLDARVLSSDFVTAVTASGQNCLVWQGAEQVGCSTVTVFAKTASRAGKVYGSGTLTPAVNENTISSITADPQADFYAIVPAENARRVMIRRAAQPYASAESAERRFSDLSVQDVICAGSGSICAVARSLHGYHMLRLDARTLETLSDITFEAPSAVSSVYCPDGCVTASYSTLVYNSFETGESIVLAAKDTTIEGIREDTVQDYRGGSAALQSDESILSAALRSDALCVWRNGQLTGTYALPEGRYFGALAVPRLWVGRNGSVMLPCHVSETDATVQAFAILDTAAGEWHFIDDLARGDAYRLMAVEDRLAVADADNCLRVYAQSGKLLWQADIPVGTASSDQLEFVDGGTYVLLRSDQQVLLYSGEKGELLYRGMLSESGTATVWSDPDRSRLYLVSAYSDTGLCVDTRTWTDLFEVGNMLAFDSGSGCAVTVRYASTLVSTHIPDTGELIEMGRKALSTEE